jgi:hypothetical protein
MLDAVAVISAMTMMAGVVFGKIFFAQLISRMRRQIAMVDQEKHKILGQLKMNQSQKKVAERNQAGLKKKKTLLEKKISRIRREMKGFKQEQEHRQKLRDTMRGKLIRPTGAEGGGDDEIEEGEEG